MPAAKKSSASVTPTKAAAFRPDRPEFIAAVSYLSESNRVLIARICRRLEQVQTAYGDDVAEATVERIIRALESEDGVYLS
jgi:hypothetical protein